MNRQNQSLAEKETKIFDVIILLHTHIKFIKQLMNLDPCLNNENEDKQNNKGPAIKKNYTTTEKQKIAL